MSKTDWKTIIGAVAPTLAATLGGPLAGMATTAISQALLETPDGTDEQIEAVIATSGPDALAKLKKVESDFRVKMKELDVDLERINAGDRASARSRQALTRDFTPAILGFVVFGGFFGILLALIFIAIPDASISPLNIMLGALATIIVQVANYYFGSSKGSSQKTEMLAGIISK